MSFLFIMSYIQGTTNSVISVAYSSPPIQTTAMGCISAVPAFFAVAVTIRPKIVVRLVIRIGRRRVTPASMIASRRSMPDSRCWLM